MGLARTVARRSLQNRPGRTLFSILGIAVGIATVVGVFTLDHNTIAGLNVRYSPEWSPDLEVRASGQLAKPRDELRAIEGVAGIAAFFQNEASVSRSISAEELGDEPPPPSRRALLIGAECEHLPDMDTYRLAAGRHLRPSAEAPEALVGARLAERLSLDIGSEILLSAPQRKVAKRCIEGVMTEVGSEGPPPSVVGRFQVVGVLTDERLGRRSNGELVITDYEPGRSLYPPDRIDSRYWLQRNPEVDVERLQAGLAQKFAYDIGRSVVVGQASDERAFRNGVRVAGLMALLLGLYVIFHTISMSLAERMREITSLHAMGATRAQIIRVFLLEAVVLAGTGGALGLAGGIYMARTLMRVGITTLGSDKFDLGFQGVPWTTVLALTGLGIGIALLGSIFPLMRASSPHSSSVLRGERLTESHAGTHAFQIFTMLLLVVLLPVLYFLIVPVVGAVNAKMVRAILLGVGGLLLLIGAPLVVPSLLSGVSRLITAPAQRLLPFAGSMTSKAIREGRRRIAVSISAVALVAAAFVGLEGMTNSLSGEVRNWANQALADRIFINDLPAVPMGELRELLAEIPEIRGVEHSAARLYKPFQVVGLPVAEMSVHGQLRQWPQMRKTMLEDHGMILSDRFARNFEYEIGDSVQLSIGGGKIQAFQVIAISDQYGYSPQPDERMYAVISDHYMLKYYCLDLSAPDRLTLILAPGTDPEYVKHAILGRLDVPGKPVFRYGQDVREIHVRDISDDFILFDIILLLTALLAGLGVLNGQLLAALERTKELGVLKALGATRSQIAGMVLLESVVVGLLGGLLGMALGNLLSPLIVSALEDLSGLDLPNVGARMWNLYSVVGALALALLAGLYPIWRMNRTDAVRAVRTG